MRDVYILQWFFQNEWKTIGWEARDERSTEALIRHAVGLASAQPDQRYRITTLLDPENGVTHVWNSDADGTKTGRLQLCRDYVFAASQERDRFLRDLRELEIRYVFISSV